MATSQSAMDAMKLDNDESQHASGMASVIPSEPEQVDLKGLCDALGVNEDVKKSMMQDTAFIKEAQLLSFQMVRIILC